MTDTAFAEVVAKILEVDAKAIARESEDQASYYDELGLRIVHAWARLNNKPSRSHYEIQQTIYTDDRTKWRCAAYAEDGGPEQYPTFEIASTIVDKLVRAGVPKERLRILRRTVTEEVITLS